MVAIGAFFITGVIDTCKIIRNMKVIGLVINLSINDVLTQESTNFNFINN